MKKVGKFVLAIAGVAIIFVIGALVALFVGFPKSQEPSSQKVELTAERVARGRYLVNHVSDCFGCHSDHHFDLYGMPVKPGTEGMGGFPFDETFGVPGVVAAQNITPDPETGLGKWTDGEVIRAFRDGITRDGDPLFPMMPYRGYSQMSDEDAEAVVAYLRTLKPVRNTVPERKLAFPMNLIVRMMPQPAKPSKKTPSRANSVEYGKYLVTIGGCVDCHTPRDSKGAPDMTRPYAGGFEMKGPWGRVVSANLTPHPDTFMGRATRDEFIGRIKSFERFNRETPPVAAKGANTVMPWIAYSGMTPEDLGAMYDYLKTLPAIENRVVTFPDAGR